MRIILLTALLVTGSAMADSLECKNEALKISYTEEKSNGETAVASCDSELVLDGNTLFKTDKLAPEPETDTAKFVLLGTKTNVGVPDLIVSEHFNDIHFYQTALVVSSDNPANIIFSGPVFCHKKVYVGP